MKYTIALFLKFGKKEDILDLYENGTVFLNTVQHFKKIEDEGLRGDNYEGTSGIINAGPGSFEIPSLNHTVNYLSAHLKESYETITGNLFCLYCVSSYGFPNPLDFKVDEKNKRFGSHCLIIKNNGKFLERIEQAFTREGYKLSHGFVKYYDRYKVNQKLSLFEKPNEYEYQKEFRFYIDSDSLKPIKVNIGSMVDYSQIIESKDLHELKASPLI